MMPHAPIEPEGMFEGLSGSAILFGAFVDIAATVIGSILLVSWLAPELMSRGESDAPAILARLSATTSYVAGNVAVGALATVLGAFVGARRAGQLQVRHGGWIAVTSTAIGVLMTAFDTPARDAADAPLWAQVIAWLLILPAGMCGGALAAALPAAGDRRA
jgi:hypothetical protein